MYFIPSDEKEVQTLFDIFSEAALNNPDEDEEEEDGDNDGGGMFPSGFIYNVDEVEAGAQQDKLNQWESVFQLPSGQTDKNVENSEGVVNDSAVTTTATTTTAATTTATTDEVGTHMDVDVL